MPAGLLEGVSVDAGLSETDVIGWTGQQARPPNCGYAIGHITGDWLPPAP
jgi:hypothetical protein